MKRFVSFVCIAQLTVIPQAIHAGWIKILGEKDYYEAGHFVQQTLDGGYILTGDKDFWPDGGDYLWLVKTDAEGDTLWTRIYGGEGFNWGNCVQQTSDSGYMVTGQVSDNVNHRTGLWLLKTDRNGDTIWTKTYYRGVGSFLQETSDGGYIITGHKGTITSEGYRRNLWLLKTNENGDTIWTRTPAEGYLSDFDNIGTCVKETSDGNYIVVGTKVLDTLADSECRSTLFLAKIDKDGELLWKKTYGSFRTPKFTAGDPFWGTIGYSISETSDEGYIISGATWRMYGGSIWVLKTDIDGDTLWTNFYGGAVEIGCHIEETHDGDYFLLGGSHLRMIKMNSIGERVWNQYYPEPRIRSGQQTNDEGYIAVGYIETSLHNNDLFLIKTDSLGNVSVKEKPIETNATNWRLLSSIGQRIVMRYEGMPEGFHAQVFNASGRKVDEVQAPLPSGSISWGECYGPGVYFIRVESGSSPSVQKVVLVK